MDSFLIGESEPVIEESVEKFMERLGTEIGQTLDTAGAGENLPGNGLVRISKCPERCQTEDLVFLPVLDWDLDLNTVVCTTVNLEKIMLIQAFGGPGVMMCRKRAPSKPAYVLYTHWGKTYGMLI